LPSPCSPLRIVPMQIVLIVLAYIVLGYFAFMIVGGLLNGIWEIIRDSIDQLSYGPHN